MDNKGGIDVGAWITAIVGFTFCWIVWSTLTPALDMLHNQIVNPSMNLPLSAVNVAHLIQKVWSYGMIINAGGWLLFILWSSIRKEVEEKQQVNYYG